MPPDDASEPPELREFDPASSRDPEVAALLAEFAKTYESWNGTTKRIAAHPPGDRLLAKDPQWSRRVILAVLEQTRHWMEERLREGSSRHWSDHSLRYRVFATTCFFEVLSRRRLPLTTEDAVAIIDTMLLGLGQSESPLSPASVLRCVARVAEEDAPEPLREALRRMQGAVSPHEAHDGPKLGRRIEELLADDSESETFPPPPSDAPPPAPAGHPTVLTFVKRRLGLLADDEDPDAEPVGFDRFPLRTDSVLAEEHGLLSRLIQECTYAQTSYGLQLENSEVGREIVALAPERRGRVLLACYERELILRAQPGDEDVVAWQVRCMLEATRRDVLVAGIELDRHGAFDAALAATADLGFSDPWALESLGHHLASGSLSDGERHVLHRCCVALITEPPLGRCPPQAKLLTQCMERPFGYVLVPGEHWADAVHADLASLDDDARMAWTALLTHARTAESARPSAKWKKAAKPLLEAVTQPAFSELALRWLAAVSRGRSIATLTAPDTINDGNGSVLRGLLWLLAPIADAGAARGIADLLITAIKKVPGVGPRAVKVANACTWALGEIAAAEAPALRDTALAQLARLSVRVTFKTTRKGINAALEKAAEAAGLTREEIEELGIPAFDFERGVRVEQFGDAEVRLTVDRHKILTTWTNDKGKRVKSPPAAVKRDFKDQLKELKQIIKDAEGILGATRDRLDSLYLADKSWPVSDWRERYFDHGLVSCITQRLIWQVGDASVMFAEDGSAHDATGASMTVGEEDVVRLWHPAARPADEVAAWRAHVEREEITQPFKQAHREIYRLTDAERTTNVYSNRFAAHILKQHQFNALCGTRSWDNALRLMVDDEYPPACRNLPAHGLRAEFWIEGVGEDYGTDTTEAGTFHWLATDQVRFYRIEAAQNFGYADGGGFASAAHGPGEGDVNEPLPLDQIPPLVLSEVLRDVDLFVGVSSVGNDPNWADGGPDGRYLDYWQGYSFGDLSATAQTRKELLQRLVPRLKIAERCTFEDRFLVVEGSIRAYRIHLGSGNILMKPNDEYLCIVPNQRAVTSASDQVFLPFEGDRTMAIILSKAFLLADDAKIKDATILSQIRPT